MSQNHGLKGLYVYIKNKEFLNRMKPDFEMEYSPIARFTNLTIKKSFGGLNYRQNFNLKQRNTF